MGTENSFHRRKKNSKKKAKEELEMVSSQRTLEEVNFDEANEKVRKKNNKKKKKSSEDATEEVNVNNTELVTVKDKMHEISHESKSSKKLKIKEKKKAKTRSGIKDIETPHANEVEDGVSDEKDVESKPAGKKLPKSRKKKRNTVESVNSIDEVNEKDNVSGRQGNFLEKRGEDAEGEVYEMSSGDEDYSRGMQKWITHYHQSRPGLKVLQERIDDFIMDHEAQEEKARAEREAQAAEGGWTVVVHHKGRKKTTDAETGIVVGSVAQAAVLDKMANKRKKDVGLGFYQFQKKEARMNEIMMLQSKFEQDKKRIQQMRAARKFRPY